MSVTRATLMRSGDGSMLAAMFSGNWEKGHKRDSQGRIFLDANPYCFDMLLSFLRLKGIEDPAAPMPFPKVTKDRKIEIEALGKGFLYKMVRSIAGALLDVGCGKIEPVQLKEILIRKKRTEEIVSAPSKGLCLEKVYYRSPFTK